MDKVIFFESEEHYEVLSAYVQSFQKYSNAHIEIYCNIKVKNYLFPIFKDGVSWKSLNHEITKELKYNRTYLIITSPIKNINQIYETGIPYYYLTHNIHSAFDPLRNLYLSWPKSIFSYLKNNSTRRYNQKIINHAKGLLFINQDLTNYFKSKYCREDSTQKYLTFPTYRNLQIKDEAEKNRQKVIIPGNYHPSRRDFNPILEILQTHTFSNLEFVFLGNLDDSLGNKIKSFKTKNNITVYENELYMVDYYKILINGDLLILPLSKFKYYGGIKEKIGLSTFSAIWMDAYSSGIPALVPDYLEVDKNFSSFFFSYNNGKSLRRAIIEYFDQDYLTIKRNFKIQIKQYFDPLIQNVVHEILND